MTETRQSILLVDDSSVNNLLLENILEEEGYIIETAFNAKEALEILNKSQIDLILLDIMMPKMNGLELLEEINGQFGRNKIPVVMVSALKEEADKARARELGAIAYLTKPLDIESVVHTVEDAMTNA